MNGTMRSQERASSGLLVVLLDVPLERWLRRRDSKNGLIRILLTNQLQQLAHNAEALEVAFLGLLWVLTLNKVKTKSK